MKNIIKQMNRRQSGQVLVIVLIFMIIGALLIPPTLSLSGTVLKSNQKYNENMDLFYAAEAGIADARYKLMTGNSEIPDDVNDPPLIYSTADAPPEINSINGADITVTIKCLEREAYSGKFRITSEAEDEDNKHTIKAVYTWKFGLFENAITSCNSINLQPNVIVNGEEAEYVDGQWWPDILIDNYEDWWPTDTELMDYYNDGTLSDYEQNIINSADTHQIGNIITEGNLAIGANSNGGTIELTGNIYVDGNFSTKKGQYNKSQTIDMNGQTIFVTGEADFDDNSTTIVGSGAIVAIGDIYFAPNLGTAEDEFIFIMSHSGTTNMQPNGDFYGAVTGSVLVNSQPNGSFNNEGFPEGLELNFPKPEYGNIAWKTNLEYWNSRRN
jgi:hypothetical protein